MGPTGPALCWLPGERLPGWVRWHHKFCLSSGTLSMPFPCLRFLPLPTLPNAARVAGTLIPSAQRLVWAAKQPLGKAALGALFA